MTMKEVMKLRKKGEKAMSKKLFSKVKPEKALSYFENAYKVLRKLPSTAETWNVQVDLLEKQADCEHLLGMDYRAAKRLEETARLLQVQWNDRPNAVAPMFVRSADIYKSGGHYFKACSAILGACQYLAKKDDKEKVENMVEKLALTCEEESFPQFRDVLDQSISLLIRMENFQKAREIMKRERDLFIMSKLK